MLFRALFWITVVAVFTPHEPDLGLGRPASSSTSLLQQTRDALTASMAHADCAHAVQTCAATAGILDSFQFSARRSLAEVKSEIERAAHDQGARGD